MLEKYYSFSLNGPVLNTVGLGVSVTVCALVLFEDLVAVPGEAGIEIAADNLVAADDLV